MATARIELFKGKKLSDGSHPIMLRLTHKSKNKYIHLGASVKPVQWIGEPENWVSKSYSGYKRLNVRIDNALNKARNIIFSFDEKNAYFTLDDITNKYIRDRNETYFNKYTSQIIEELRKSKKIGNASVYQTTLNVVKEYMNNSDLHIVAINTNWLSKFENYKLSKGVSINGVSLYLRTIRAIYNKAIKEKLVSKDSYPFGRDSFQIRNSPTQKRAISNDNIHLIRDLSLEPYTSIWHSKNYFMFSFYTRGMSWVDMAHLKIRDIADGRINYIRRKTIRKSSKSFSVKINPQIQQILNYYIQNKTKDEYVFPIIRRPESMDDTRKDIMNEIKTFNKYLKKIAEMTGIEANLTSYVARHSWGTIAKKIGIDINVISDGYGHSDPSVTRVYLDSIENEDIDMANELITR